MSQTMLTTIPFAGFYASLFSGALDFEEESYINCRSEENGDDPETLADALYKSSNYAKAFQYIAKEYVDYFNDYIKDEFDLDLELKFESMQSPREYNFETDRIFCHISEENVRKLRTLVGDEELRTAIKTRFTSRSGFISSYDNDLDDWPDLELWDHNEVGTLFVALLGEGGDWEWDICENMNEVFYHAFEEGVDWAKFDEFLKEEV